MRQPARVNSTSADQNSGANAASRSTSAEEHRRAEREPRRPGPAPEPRHHQRRARGPDAHPAHERAVAPGLLAQHVTGEHRQHGDEGEAEHAEGGDERHERPRPAIPEDVADALEQRRQRRHPGPLGRVRRPASAPARRSPRGSSGAFAKKQAASPTVAMRPPAIAGPITRARLNALDPSAMAFIRSSRPTISATSDCRVGTSNADSVPKKSARTPTHATVMWPSSVSTPSASASSSIPHWSEQDQPPLVHPVRDHAAVEGEEQDRQRPEGRHQSHQEGRVGELEHQPPLRYRLDPGAAERHELAEKEEAEIAVAEGRCQR